MPLNSDSLFFVLQPETAVQLNTFCAAAPVRGLRLVSSNLCQFSPGKNVVLPNAGSCSSVAFFAGSLRGCFSTQRLSYQDIRTEIRTADQQRQPQRLFTALPKD